MNINKLSLANWGVPLLYIIAVFVFLTKFVQPELHYHLQQPEFLSNVHFFSQYTNYPGGIAEYIGSFLSQLYAFNWLGSVVLLILAGFLYFIAGRIFSFFIAIRSFSLVSAVPVILFLSLFNNYYFPLAAGISIQIAFLFSYLFLLSHKKGYNLYLSFFILGALTYYLAGSGAYLIFTSGILLSILFLKEFKKPFLSVAIIVVASLILPYLGFRYVFNIPLQRAYFGFIPDLPRIINYQPGSLFKLLVISLSLTIILLAIVSEIKRRKMLKKENEVIGAEEKTEIEADKKKIAFGFWATVVLVSSLSFLVWNKSHNSYMKSVVLVDFYNYSGEWDKAIEASIAERRYNVFINFNYNRAISKKGVLIDRFFDYPQMSGSTILFPNAATGTDIALVSSDFYYDLGYMSEALHWAHEAQTLFPSSPRVLKRMVKANLVFGNYRTAEKYLKVLNENFLSKSFVNQYMPYVSDTALASRDKEIIKLRACLPRGCVASDAETNFQNLLVSNPANKGAYEHLQLYYLLGHKLDDFFSSVNRGNHFYKSMPTLFQEVLIVRMIENNSPKLQQFKPNSLNKDRLFHYKRIMKKYNNDIKAAKPEFYKHIGNTYMYYLIYYRPKKSQG